MKSLLFGLFGLALVSSVAAQADFRCPNTAKVIHPGLSSYEVEASCGAPASKVSLTTAAALTATPAVEEWTYDFGPSQFIRIVRIEGDVVASDTAGGYGLAKKVPSSDEKAR